MSESAVKGVMAGRRAEAGEARGWRWEFTYLEELPEVFFALVEPERPKQPRVVFFNRELAAEMGLPWETWSEEEMAAWFGAAEVPPGARPFAQAYAGHQFGHFTMLGDGRAMVLGEQVGADGRRRDVQWKGSGRTPFSRRGDGKAALGPMLREVIYGEALHALGVPCSRALAVALTGGVVYRDRPLMGAVLTRVAASHLRVGTVEYAAALRERGALEALVRYALRRHYPERAGEAWPGRALLEEVTRRQVELVVAWMALGFVHGVMNTDNTSLSGEAIDFGPCAFLDGYAAGAVFSSIDQFGRYAYGRQPDMVFWNLARLAEALLPVIDEREEEAVAWAEGFLKGMRREFEEVWLGRFCAKLGLVRREEGDRALVEGLLGWMEKRGADFTGTFRHLAGVARQGEAAGNGLEGDAEFAGWLKVWRQRLQREEGGAKEAARRMARVNPAVHPRNHCVERALAEVEQGQWGLFKRLLDAVSAPWEEREEDAWLREERPEDLGAHVTFCGT